MSRKNVFILAALIPAVGSALGAYWVGRAQGVKPALVTQSTVADPYAYPGATLVSETTGSGVSIHEYTTTDDNKAIRAFYQKLLCDPILTEQKKRQEEMMARLPALAHHSSLYSHNFTLTSSSNFTASFGASNSRIEMHGSPTECGVEVKSGGKTTSVTLKQEGNTTHIRTMFTL
jgi:hypothetical protein